MVSCSRMLRFSFHVALACAFVLLYSSLLPGQILTGTIGGTVTDASSAVVGDVKVTVQSPNLIGGAKSMSTSATGTYRFQELPPGTYSITFEKAGFKAYTAQGIVVNTGVQVTTNATLQLGEVSQNITVQAEAATIDTEHVTASSVANKAIMEGIPTGRSPWAIADTVPSAVGTGSGSGSGPIDVGGSNGMQQVGLAAYGSNPSADQKFMIDGVSVNWPGGGGGSTLMYYDVGMFQEVNYLVGDMPADVSQGGVYMNMVTKSGTNQIHGTVFLNGASQGMQSNNVGPALASKLFANVPASVASKINFANVIPGNPMTETYDYNGNVGGALIKDKLWWVTSWRLWAYNNLVAGSFNPDGTQALNDNKIADEMGKFDYQINEKNRMTLMYFRNQKNRFHRRLQGSFGSNDTTVLQNQPGYDAAVTWIFNPSSRWVFNTGFALTAGKTPYRYQPDLAPGLISVYDSSTLTLYNAPQYNYINPVYRGALDSYASYFTSDWGGTHNIRFGVQASKDGYQQRYTVNGDVQGVLVNGIPTTASIYPTPLNIQKNNLDVLGLYAEDSWHVLKHLTINVGIRWERWDGWIPPESSPAGTYIGARSYQQIKGPDWNNWTPRFGFAWDVTGKGKTVLKGGVNRYMQGEGMNLLTSVNPMQFLSGSVPWTCPTTEAVATCISNGPTASQLNLSKFTGFPGLTTSLAPNLQRPFSWEESLGIQQQLPSNIILSVTGWHRSTFNQIGIANTAVPQSDYTPVTINNPLTNKPLVVYNQLASTIGQAFQNNVIENSNRLNNDYRALDVEFRRSMTRNWMMFGGVTWSRFRGAWLGDINSAGPGASSVNLNNPNFNANMLGSMQYDIPLIFRIGGTYNLPWGFVVSTIYQHLTGAPNYASYSVTSGILGQTINQGTQTVYLQPSGFNRLPNINTWDIRFSKVFKLHDRYEFQPQFNIYNLTNSSAVQSVNESVNSALYLNPSTVIPPRVFEVGLRVSF